MKMPVAEARLIVYGHQDCSLSRWLRRELEENQIEFEWRDVKEGFPRFQDELSAVAHGNLSVPTVIFPDGKVLIEPRPKDVLDQLRSSRRTRQQRVIPNHAELLARLLKR